MSPSVRAYLALGANLGDRASHLDFARAQLAFSPGVTLIAASTVREYAAVGGPEQPPYLNQVLALDTTLTPAELLALAHRIEAARGRTRTVHHGPRTLDIDVLIHGTTVSTDGVLVPHPRLAERLFVLEPLAELAGELVVPGLDTSVAALLARARARVTTLEITRDLPSARAALARLERSGARIGFVPTMGALHAGHISLIERAHTLADVVVASIFVNPLQFAPTEDLARYPRDLEGDARLLAAAGTHLLFTAQPADFYPPGFSTYVEPRGSRVAGLCARSRPGHFTGVATIVLKLLNLVRPDVAVFGQKDLQQAMILSHMAADLELAPTLVIAPTVREADGLAMSSRNRYLEGTRRQEALALSRGLAGARAAWAAGERRVPELVERVRAAAVGSPNVRWDYVEVVRLPDLEPLVDEAVEPFAIACAAFVGNARLIDNVVVPHDALAVRARVHAPMS